MDHARVASGGGEVRRLTLTVEGGTAFVPSAVVALVSAAEQFPEGPTRDVLRRLAGGEWAGEEIKNEGEEPEVKQDRMDEMAEAIETRIRDGGVRRDLEAPRRLQERHGFDAMELFAWAHRWAKDRRAMVELGATNDETLILAAFQIGYDLGRAERDQESDTLTADARVLAYFGRLHRAAAKVVDGGSAADERAAEMELAEALPLPPDVEAAVDGPRGHVDPRDLKP